jgi:hypothetical protein
MTGSSHVEGGQHHVHRERIGDHRGHGTMKHTGSRNSSIPPKPQAGRPIQNIPMRNGNGNGDEAA